MIVVPIRPHTNEGGCGRLYFLADECLVGECERFNDMAMIMALGKNCPGDGQQQRGLHREEHEEFSDTERETRT